MNLVGNELVIHSGANLKITRILNLMEQNILLYDQKIFNGYMIDLSIQMAAFCTPFQIANPLVYSGMSEFERVKLIKK